MLVASGGDAAPAAAAVPPAPAAPGAPAVKGIVTIGPESRVVADFAKKSSIFTM